MKPSKQTSRRRASPAFTLIELIGVLAIMAILASVLVPNVLKSIDRAAVAAEGDTLANLGAAATRYLSDGGAVLTSANWESKLSPYASLSSTALLTNPRGNVRVYVPDPGIGNRVLLISSMRAGVALPSPTTIGNNFGAIWEWNETSGVQPAGFPAAWVNYLDYLVIERINFESIDQAAIRAERDALANISAAASLCFSNGVVPTYGNWSTVLRAYTSLSSAALLTNFRGNARIYVPDPTVGNQVLLISSLRAGVGLPSPTTIANNFAAIWEWNETSGVQPAGFPATWVNSLGYLVIVRINFESLDQAAISAERDALANVSTAASLCFSNGVVPTYDNWSTVLRAYTSLSSTALLTNSRGNVRIYVPDPTPGKRAMILSSMRAGVALPLAATILAKPSNFETIWNSSDDQAPLVVGLNVLNIGIKNYLVIERINYQSIYQSELQSYPFSLNNISSGATASYQIVRASGTVDSWGNVLAGGKPVSLPPLYPRDRINLYRAAGANPNDLVFTYVVSPTGKTFSFDGTNWLPQ